MSENHSEEHESPIKTPKQLIIVVVLAFIVPIGLIVLLSQLLTTGLKTGEKNSAANDAAVAARLKPVGQVEVTDPNAPKVEKSGKEIVEAVCSACHGSGALGAPKIGDKAAWAPRLKQGQEVLYTHALKGFKAMPPKGGAADLPDAQIKATVDYLSAAGK